MDRTELEKNIFTIVDSANFKEGPTSEVATAQIIALIDPLIEEAKKQERERIFKELENRIPIRNTPPEWWQALKEGK